MSPGARFRALIAERSCLVTPGIYDALSARVAEQVGFPALAISGFGVEAALLGKPDVGLLTLSELVDQARRIAAVVDVPITCDGETGFGGVHAIARLVHGLEDAGIAGVQLEDQQGPKRCPAIEGRDVVSLEEQLARLGAAIAARRDPNFAIIARSDADVLGIDALIERCNRYLAAGADIAMPICFVVDGRPIGDLSPDDQMDICARLARAIDGPVKGVLVPEGYTVQDMGAIGYSIVGLSAGPIEAAVNALHASLSELLRTGTETTYRSAHRPAFAAPRGIMELLGIDAMLAFEARFREDGGK